MISFFLCVLCVSAVNSSSRVTIARMRRIFTWWKDTAERLEAETHALILAYRPPRTPWYARVLALLVAADAFSPIDLIPDFIPVLGALDDLLIVPAGVWLVLRLVQADVMAECRARAAQAQAARPPGYRWMTVVVVLVWAALLGAVVYALFR